MGAGPHRRLRGGPRQRDRLRQQRRGDERLLPPAVSRRVGSVPQGHRPERTAELQLLQEREAPRVLCQGRNSIAILSFRIILRIILRIAIELNQFRE